MESNLELPQISPALSWILFLLWKYNLSQSNTNLFQVFFRFSLIQESDGWGRTGPLARNVWGFEPCSRGLPILGPRHCYVQWCPSFLDQAGLPWLVGVQAGYNFTFPLPWLVRFLSSEWGAVSLLNLPNTSSIFGVKPTIMLGGEICSRLLSPEVIFFTTSFLHFM